MLNQMHDSGAPGALELQGRLVTHHMLLSRLRGTPMPEPPDRTAAAGGMLIQGATDPTRLRHLGGSVMIPVRDESSGAPTPMPQSACPAARQAVSGWRPWFESRCGSHFAAGLRGKPWYTGWT